jgi:uncharacterized membrane protein YbhN (UPF0104 family)
MKSNKYLVHTLKYVLAIILLGLLIKLFITPADLKLLESLNLINILKIIACAFLTYLISGIQYYYTIYKQTGKKLKLIDVATLPLSAGLWGMIIPLQGAFIYLTTLLKYKYKTSIKDSIAIGSFSYIVSVAVTGLAGVYYFAQTNFKHSHTMLLLSAVLVVLPILLFLTSYLFKKAPIIKVKKVQTLREHLQDIINSLAVLMQDKKTVAIVLITNLLNDVLTAVWFYVIAQSLKIDISIVALFFMGMFLKLAVIIKLTPGNIGVEEFISGILLTVAGTTPAVGILLTLVARISSIILLISIGLIATIYNTKFIKNPDL